MDTSVNLQAPFHYALWPIIAVGSLVVILIAAIVAITLIKRRKPKIAKKSSDTPKLIDLAAAKKKALKELDKLLSNFMNDKISTRDAYQSTSFILRDFVHKVTGIKVINLTLAEIRKVNLPSLEKLVMEYYPPEFQSMSRGDVGASINRTKKVIEEWK